MRLLLLTSGLPWPLEMHGGAQRTALLLGALQKVATVDLAIVSWSLETLELAKASREKVSSSDIVGVFEVPYAADVSPTMLSKLPLFGGLSRTAGVYSARYRRDRKASEWLHRIVKDGRYSGVVSRFRWPGARAGIGELRDVPTLLDWDDLDHQKLASEIKAKPWRGLSGKAAQRLVFSRVRKLALQQASAYDHIWVTKPNDVLNLRGPSFSVLPNIPYPEEATQAEPVHHGEIVFVGNLSYSPNAEALSKFLTGVWPRIRAHRPETRLLAIGPLPAADTAARWRATPGVQVVGPVPFLRPYYRQAAISICPIEWGGGTNIKAIEALSYGVPCVMSSYSYAAFCSDFDADRGMVRADGPEAFAQACLELLNDPQKCERIGAAGREITRARYSTTHFDDIVRNGLKLAGL